MKIKSFEFKARVEEFWEYENLLLKFNPVDYGSDH
jgi:hypothetical protein